MDPIDQDLYTFCSPSGMDAATGSPRRELPGKRVKPVRKEEQGAEGSASAYKLLGVGASEYRMGRPQQALKPLLEATTRLASVGDPDALLEALLLCGRTERDIGLLEDAARHFQVALDLACNESNQSGQVDALNLQAGLLSAQGDHFGALEHLSQALSAAREARLVECQANILNNLGSLHTLLGDYSRALGELQAAYELIRQFTATSRSEAMNLINLGHLYREMGDLHGAQEFYARARETGRALDDQMIEVVSLNSLANILSRTGEWVSARELYHEALQLARRLGFSKYEVDNLDGLGEAHAALGEHQRAIAAHRQALTITREISDPEGELDSLINLGRNYLATEQCSEAVQALMEAYDSALRLDRTEALIDAHELLGQAYEKKNDLPRALGHQRAMHSLKVSLLNEKCEQRSTQLSRLYESECARREAERHRFQRLQKARDEAETRVLQRTRELEKSQMEMVARLANAAEYRDDETGQHTRRVGCISAAIAQILGWPEEQARLISWAARLHDVGKLGVRDTVLLKRGKLTSDEFTLIQAHTTIGASILSGSSSSLLRMAEEIALSHHERWDGTGYPLGLSKDEIPVSARIVAVADTFDALVNERPYKPAWSREDALTEIRRQSGHQFDPKVVTAFLEAIQKQSDLPNAAMPGNGYSETASSEDPASTSRAGDGSR